MEERKFYELNPSQEVVKLQFDYTLFKRVVNIIMSATFEEKVDFDLMGEAINKLIERNDCLRLRFVKKDKKLLQYFEDERVLNDIKYLEFKTKAEQDKFILKIRKKAVKYTKGEVFVPYFIKTYDGKDMVLLKVCHLVLDMYGLYFIFKDLFEIYNALKNKTELPPLPKKFEDVLKNDLRAKADTAKEEENEEYFRKKFASKEEPYYLSFDGGKNKYCRKRQKKGIRAGKSFLVFNDTDLYSATLPHEVVKDIMSYAQQAKITPANILLYAMTLTLSKINGNVKNTIPLELCNARGTLLEKGCGGTKVKAAASYVEIDENKSFADAVKEFAIEQTENYRHIYFSEMRLTRLIHQVYNSSMLSTYWPFSFSYIPFAKPKGLEYQVYSNGKTALPCYVALSYDPESGELVVMYDFVKRLMKKQDLANFNIQYAKVLEQIAKQPDILIKDIEA